MTFNSAASNLAAGDANGTDDIFVHDRLTGITERVNVSNAGSQANDSSLNPSMSGDGRRIVMGTFASNLIPNDTNGRSDVFLRTRW